MRDRCSGLMPVPVSEMRTTAVLVLERQTDPELAPRGHGVEGVEDNVDEDLLEALALGIDGRDGLELEDQADVHVLELVVDEGQDLLEALLEIDALE